MTADFNTPAILRRQNAGAAALEPPRAVPRRRASDRIRPVRTDKRPQMVLLALCVAGIACLWAGLLAFSAAREQAVVERVHSEVRNLAIVLEEQVQRTVLSVDQMMRFAKAELEENPAAFDLDVWTKRAPAIPDVVLQVALIDARGRATTSLARAAESTVSVADREYFRVHAESADVGLYLSRPVLGRVSGRWLIQASRRLDAADGSFAGVIVVSIDPLAIGRIFSSINTGPGGSVILLGPDGHTRARSPEVDGMFERSIADAPGGRAILDQMNRERSGVIQARSPVDGVERMLGFRSLGGLPLIVGVGESVDAALKPVREERRWIVLGGVGITAFLVVTFGFLFRLLHIRQRKEAELAQVNMALAEGEARYRLLADNATDVIARIGMDGVFRYVSPAIKNIGGYDAEELIGNETLDLMHPEDQARLWQHLGALIAAGPDAPRAAFEYRGWHKEGYWRWYEINPTIVFDPKSGEPVEIVDVIRDISARKAIEEELRAKTQLLETTLESMDEGLIMIDADGRIVVCNQRAIDLMGFPPELMAQQPHFRDLARHQAERGEYGQGDSDFERWIDEGSIASEAPLYERVRPNGTVVEVRTVALGDGGVVRTYTDITARRRAERAGRESEERYRLLAENASDIIMLRVLNGPRRYVSPACLPMLGYGTEELLEIPARELIHPDDYMRVMAIYGQLAVTRQQIRDVHRLRHKDGRWVWVEGAFRLVDMGAEPMVLASIRDVTDRQLKAEQLEAAKEQAEQLLQKAQAASEAKTDFLASMSHEIRTPLNSIIGFTNLVLETDGLTPDQRRQIEQVRGSGQALLTVVNDILDFSKIEAGQVELDPQPFSLQALIDNAVSIVRGIALDRGIPIEVSVEPGLPRTVVGDGDRLRQILLNLLNNAVKFTRQGQVTLAVRRAPGGLHFAVADTGIGIPEDKLPRLFERFTQVDSSIRRRFGGTGLGLAICKRLVGLMGGEIGVESREGEGSTFWFEVALPETAAPLPITTSMPRHRPTKPVDILLVEDVDINQELARLILEKAGHRVDIASDGAEALQAVRRKSYDLVLMDVQMPVMDGITATERMRRMEEPVASLPIIAMTANVLPDQITRFRQAGMNDHVGKPFQAAELLATIARWTEGRVLDRAS